MSKQFFSHVAKPDESLSEMFRLSRERVILEDGNMMNPVSFLNLFRLGWFKWLFTKGEVYNTSRWEDIHSAFHWRRKIKPFASELKFFSLVPFADSLLGKFLEFVYKYFGNVILLVAYKRLE